MTLTELEQRVSYQTNNEIEDFSDYSTHLIGYINEGYDLLLVETLGVHVGDTGYPLLASGTDTPVADIPAWVHPAIADYATYLVYRNGSSQRQSRGFLFLSSFNRAKSRLMSLSHPKITNIPQ